MTYTEYEKWRRQCDELNNRKIPALGLQDILKVEQVNSKLVVCDIKGKSIWIANDRDLAEAFIYGVYFTLQRTKLF